MFLKKNLFDSMAKLELPNDFIFQQDHDSKHCSKLTNDFFSKKKVNVPSWPSQSSDLNPIQHLWAELERQISLSDRTSVKKFEEALKKTFKSIEVDYCKKLVNSMPQRLRVVLRAKGLNTFYENYFLIFFNKIN